MFAVISFVAAFYIGIVFWHVLFVLLLSTSEYNYKPTLKDYLTCFAWPAFYIWPRN